MSAGQVVVVGGSIAGLAAALALTGSGRRVTLLERDAAPLPATPLEAFQSWQRPGAPQTRHAHAFLSRLRNLLRERAPELLAKLLAAGARAAFRRCCRRVCAAPVPEDEDLHAARAGGHLRVGAAATRHRGGQAW
jgi:glycine/D-amino acid oxidase-like deaminating enzyme